ncbi:MAG: hypothetical protein WKF84_29865 [Pyrinomonadaceae bacterium]
MCSARSTIRRPRLRHRHSFVATLYGVGVANLLLFPIASRLRERHEVSMKRREALATH